MFSGDGARVLQMDGNCWGFFTVRVWFSSPRWRVMGDMSPSRRGALSRQEILLALRVLSVQHCALVGSGLQRAEFKHL